MIQLTTKREKPLVGLEIDAGSVAAVEVRGAGSAEPTKTAIAALPEGAFHDGEVVDPDAVSAVLRTLFAENKLSKRVRLGVSNQRVVVRTMRLPAIDDPRELDAAVRFQAQEQIPMPLDQAILDYRVVGGTAATEEATAKIDVILVAARREMIEASLQPLRKAGLQPIGIDLSAFGLIRALGDARPIDQDSASNGENVEQVADAPGATLYCNVGETTNLAVAKRSSCLFTRVAPIGLGTIATELTERTELTPDHARMWLSHVGLTQPLDQVAGDAAIVAAARGSLENGVAALQGELRLSLDFYAAQADAEPVERVVLGGPGSAISGFADQIEAGFNVPFEVGRPRALGQLDPQTAARLTLSYGLALDA
jgi:type IV pilus assembly protein PilM